MPLVSLSTLVPRIGPLLRGCEDGMIMLALRDAARRFCIESEAWREPAVLTLAGGAREAGPITVPADYDATVLRVASLRQGSMDVGDDLWTVNPVAVIECTRSLGAKPVTLSLEVVYLPLASCTQYPEWLLSRWGDSIEAGAVAWLKLQAGKPWSDPQGAEPWYERWRTDIGRAKAENMIRRRTGTLSVPMRPFV